MLVIVERNPAAIHRHERALIRVNQRLEAGSGYLELVPGRTVHAATVTLPRFTKTLEDSKGTKESINGVVVPS